MAMITDLLKGATRHPALLTAGVGMAFATTHVHPFRAGARGISMIATGDPNALTEFDQNAVGISAFDAAQSVIPGLQLNAAQIDESYLGHENLRANYYAGPNPNVDTDITDIPTPQSLGISSGSSQNPGMGNIVMGLYNNRLKG